MKSIHEMQAEACFGCGVCAEICPTGTISMEYRDGFLNPTVSVDACIACGKCVKMCPALNEIGRNEISEAWIAVCKDQKIYEKATSGGVFGMLAHYVVENLHGVACGAAWTNELLLHHTFAESAAEIEALQGSKYIQSDTSGIFQKAKEILESDRYLLFSGTPCQIAALRSFLGREYEKLFCVDLVCHGVPGPELFRDHIRCNIAKGKQVTKILFRTKDKYDRYGFNLCVETANKRLMIPGRTDPFYRLFLSGASFRESCYQCPFANRFRTADLTIGDCGNSNFYCDFHRDKTISTVYPVTEKGKRLWDAVNDQFHVCMADTEYEIKANAQLNHPSKRPSGRTGLYPCTAGDIYHKAERILGKVPARLWLKEKVKRILPEITRGKILQMIKERRKK